MNIKDIKYTLFVFYSIIYFTTGCTGISSVVKIQKNKVFKLEIPPDGKIYHSAYPDFGGEEDIVSFSRLKNFEELAEKKIVWAYFSNNWTIEKGGIKFPKNEVEIINKYGRIPFIRMMPRSEFKEGGPDINYTMAKIISGRFDKELKKWAVEAKSTNIPLLVEFGTEVNGNWFPWNAEFNGKDSTTGYGDPTLYEGMERFRDAYRHIIDICNNTGVNNITWFFHIDVNPIPKANWNRRKGYYPGDDYIDWIGISVYGAQESNTGWWQFADILRSQWNDIMSISEKEKPIAILEWGTIDNKKDGNKAEWITNAINSIIKDGEFYPTIKAISYWHENFDDTNLRIDSSPETLKAYKKAVSNNKIFRTKPLIKNCE